MDFDKHVIYTEGIVLTCHVKYIILYYIDLLRIKKKY